MLVLLLTSFLGACCLPPLARRAGRGAGFIVALLPIGLCGALVSMAPGIEKGWVRSAGGPWAPSLGLDFTLRLDGFSFLFCLLITSIGALVTIYADGYFATKPRSDRSRFQVLILLFMTAMLGTVLAENMLVMLMFWEATSILSFLLVGFDGRSARSRRAALMALQVTAFGGLMLLAAIMMIGHQIGTYSMSAAIEQADTIAASAHGDAVVACILIAAFTKSAQFPFHFWLPNAMQAPTPASAYLHSATMVKLGVYLLARFEPAFAATSWGRTTVITVACVTMLIAAVQALRAENFKSALAHSTIASLGILVLLVGLDGPAATVAMVGFLLAHAMYKAALFFCAGSVIHATGLHSLRSMGGLARLLPLTAAATAGASLSMAGIPPFIGFVSKEFLFEAQLESSWALLPLAIAVLVNAVMVGVAGVITLRPFFMGQGKVTQIRHRESLAIAIPPLLLAMAGLVISLEPDWITRAALRPAVAAVYGRPVDVDIAVWHGVTPMLLLSAVVVLTGAFIIRFWRKIHDRLRGIDRLDVFSVERLWAVSLRALVGGSLSLTRRIQHGDLRRYLLTVMAGMIALLTWSVIAAGAFPKLPITGSVDLASALVAAIALGGAIMAALGRSLIASMVATGLTGFAVAVTFLLNNAPDLALTQFAVEALLVVLLTALLIAVPLTTPPTRTSSMRWVDLTLALALAALLALAVLDMASALKPSSVSELYGRLSYVAAHGRNVVNVILVDFRAFDTLGETTVIAVAAVLARSLLMSRDSKEGAANGHKTGHYSFRAFGWPLAGLVLACSLAILWRGHNDPGGGFVGGLMAALAFAIVSLAYGVGRAEHALRVRPLTLVGIGLALALLSGIPAILVQRPYLTQLWWEPAQWLPAIGTALLFDLGVYLVVLGAVLTFLFGLQREASR
ncbi:hydrogen gas-evolving membrane-bound hydrogenase subunit E [Novosphingobium sp. ZW T3_23]|uniref:hydrogen gas-evolving membrane-bound hydrogenase subunit E n=1 Tax=Novosphingobium sp. ZW T3_23 TaxID=3378084 RepID=UPI003853E5C4